MIHKNVVGDDAIHQAAYIQTADPGAVGAWKIWIDITVPALPVYNYRNAGNTAWVVFTAGDAFPIPAIGALDAGKVVTVNPGHTAYELDLPAGGLPVIGALDAGKVVTVNVGHTAYELDVPAAGGGGTWTLVSKPTAQSTTSTTYINDTALVTPSLAAGTYRFRLSIFMDAVGSGGFQCTLTVPANTLLRCRRIQQDIGSGTLGTGGNIGATIPVYLNGNVGSGWLMYDMVITTSAAGVIQFQFHAVNGGNTATVQLGSYLEYRTA